MHELDVTRTGNYVNIKPQLKKCINGSNLTHLTKCLGIKQIMIHKVISISGNTK
jgi:hypothetical protein